MWGGGGFKGFLWDFFFNLDCLREDFKAIFKPILVILQAIFLCHFQEVDAWGRQHSFVGHSLPSSDSRRAIVRCWRKNVHCTG